MGNRRVVVVAVDASVHSRGAFNCKFLAFEDSSHRRVFCNYAWLSALLRCVSISDADGPHSALMQDTFHTVAKSILTLKGSRQKSTYNVIMPLYIVPSGPGILEKFLNLEICLPGLKRSWNLSFILEFRFRMWHGFFFKIMVRLSFLKKVKLCPGLNICLKQLRHCGRDKMVANFLTTFSNGFSWTKMYEFRLKYY